MTLNKNKLDVIYRWIRYLSLILYRFEYSQISNEWKCFDATCWIKKNYSAWPAWCSKPLGLTSWFEKRHTTKFRRSELVVTVDWEQFPSELPLPCTYPKPDSGIQLEWSFPNSIDADLEVDLISHTGLWTNYDMSNNCNPTTQKLALDENSDWNWLIEKIKSLSEVRVWIRNQFGKSEKCSRYWTKKLFTPTEQSAWIVTWLLENFAIEMRGKCPSTVFGVQVIILNLFVQFQSWSPEIRVCESWWSYISYSPHHRPAPTYFAANLFVWIFLYKACTLYVAAKPLHSVCEATRGQITMQSSWMQSIPWLSPWSILQLPFGLRMTVWLAISSC